MLHRSSRQSLPALRTLRAPVDGAAGDDPDAGGTKEIEFGRASDVVHASATATWHPCEPARFRGHSMYRHSRMHRQYRTIGMQLLVTAERHVAAPRSPCAASRKHHAPDRIAQCCEPDGCPQAIKPRRRPLRWLQSDLRASAVFVDHLSRFACERSEQAVTAGGRWPIGAPGRT